MENKFKNYYITPQAEVVPIVVEGMICDSPGGSGENMDPENGGW